MKPLGSLLAMTVVVAFLAGCGGGEGTDAKQGRPSKPASAVPASSPPSCPTRSDQVRVTLDGHAGPGNVGILMAEAKGFFRDAGLRIRVESPADPAEPLPDVAGGHAAIGVAQQPQVIIGRDEGAPLIAIRSLIAQPTEAMIWLRGSGIDGLADLEGKTIAYPGVPFQRDLLESALARAGLTWGDVKTSEVGYDFVPTLLSGKADAIFGGSWNLEGATLEARGARPVITKTKALGLPDYEESVVIAPYECVYKHPGLYRDFLAAVARGTRVAVGDSRAAARVIEEAPGSTTGIGRRELEAQLKATLPLLSKDGLVDPGIGQPLLEWMERRGLIGDEWSFAVIFTNYYL
jgi:putative hydroxymethylpyrimidine transport system substrate-binding protein